MERSFFALYRRICSSRTEMCVFALSSERIQKLLHRAYPTAKEAFLALREAHVTDVEVLPMFLSDGTEYRKVQVLSEKQRTYFEQVTVRPPVLPRKAEETAEWFDKRHPAVGHPILLIGHGSEEGGAGYDAVQQALLSRGRTDMHVVLIHNVKQILDRVDAFYENGAAIVEGIPFMISAGRHIREVYELIREECRKKGIQPLLDERGMGEDPETMRLFI